MTSKKLPACVRRSSPSPLFLSSNFVIRFWSEEVCALAARLAKTRIEQKSPYRIQRSFISASWGREASSARNGLHFKLIVLSVLVQSPACLRSEGPSVSSPVREGGVATTISSLSAEGAPRFVPSFGPLVIERLEFPALTDGAINSRSFGPKSLTSTVIARRDNHFDLSKRQDKNVISLMSFRSFPVRRCRLTHHRADHKVELSDCLPPDPIMSMSTRAANNSTSRPRFLYLRDSQTWLVLLCLLFCSSEVNGQSLTPARTNDPLGVKFTNVAP